MDKLRTFFALLGPGLLFAGAAVGVSHLVQATRAGAEYGWGLLWVVLLIHLFKYPFFEFGPRYAVATGESLLHGYARMGRWVVWIFAALTLLTMFTVQAGVTLVTASVTIHVLSLPDQPLWWSAAILLCCFLILLWGRYRTLDLVMKYIVVALALSTLAALVLVLWRGGAPRSAAFDFPLGGAGLTFLIALMGWMPAPLDLSVWHSLWANEKGKARADFSLSRALLDFRIGYAGSIVLAVAFLALGAYLMYGSGAAFSDSGAAFAGQLIAMYAGALGDWASGLIGFAALATMFSTTLTVFDAQPRVMAKAAEVLAGAKAAEAGAYQRHYWVWMGVMVLGSLLLLALFIGSMRQMVTLATVLSFLTTPFFAIANLRLVSSQHLPAAQRPPLWQLWLARLGVLFLLAFSGLFLYDWLLA